MRIYQCKLVTIFLFIFSFNVIAEESNPQIQPPPSSPTVEAKDTDEALYKLCVQGVRDGVTQKLQAEKATAENNKDTITSQAIVNMQNDPVFQSKIKSIIDMTCLCAGPKIKNFALKAHENPTPENNAELAKQAQLAFDECMKR